MDPCVDTITGVTWLQIWPPGGSTCMSKKCGHKVASHILVGNLAINGNLSFPYWQIISYSMIICNCQKVNQSNSVLKPLPRLPNVPKVAYVWDILIFQTPVTFRFTGESHGAYLNLKMLVNIEGIWWKFIPSDSQAVWRVHESGQGHSWGT